MNYHQMTLIGRLAEDPQMQGETCCFTLELKSKGSVEHIPVQALTATGKHAHQYLRKGREVLVVGRLAPNERAVIASFLQYGRQ